MSAMCQSTCGQKNASIDKWPTLRLLKIWQLLEFMGDHLLLSMLKLLQGQSLWNILLWWKTNLFRNIIHNRYQFIIKFWTIFLIFLEKFAWSHIHWENKLFLEHFIYFAHRLFDFYIHRMIECLSSRWFLQRSQLSHGPLFQAIIHYHSVITLSSGLIYLGKLIHWNYIWLLKSQLG